MTLTNIFGHWLNLSKVSVLCENEYENKIYTNVYFSDNNPIVIENKRADEVAHEINRKSVQNETDIFKLELRPISEIETVTDYNRDKDVLVKLSEYSYGSYSFNYVLQNWEKNSKSYWTHFALLP